MTTDQEPAVPIDGDVRHEAEGESAGEAPTRYRRVMSASSLTGDRVRNPAGEDLGRLEEIMIDIPTGQVAYAVISFGGFLGIGDKLFAVPWRALTLNERIHEYVLEVDRKRLEDAPGFDPDHWPDSPDPSWAGQLGDSSGPERG